MKLRYTVAPAPALSCGGGPAPMPASRVEQRLHAEAYRTDPFVGCSSRCSGRRASWRRKNSRSVRPSTNAPRCSTIGRTDPWVDAARGNYDHGFSIVSKRVGLDRAGGMPTCQAAAVSAIRDSVRATAPRPAGVWRANTKLMVRGARPAHGIDRTACYGASGSKLGAHGRPWFVLYDA